MSATACSISRRGSWRSFNSRARVGATSRPAQRLPRRCEFQFTRPGGRDPRARQTDHPRQSFNSRARVGATRALTPPTNPPHSFNSRARVGATPRRRRSTWRAWRFNSRARVGATPHPCPSKGQSRFQFTRPGGRDTLRTVTKATTAEFQFTRPGGRDDDVGEVEVDGRVSIHAPGWARPAPPTLPPETLRVSIHAPGWARPRRCARASARAPFQFTRPGGRDG